MANSSLETKFTTLWEQVFIGMPYQRPPFVREHTFHAERNWRLDFAWPDVQVAVELDGGTSRIGRSRHTRPKGFQNDCDKLNAAVMEGWSVLRFTAKDIRDRPIQCLELTEALIKRRKAA